MRWLRRDSGPTDLGVKFEHTPSTIEDRPEHTHLRLSHDLAIGILYIRILHNSRPFENAKLGRFPEGDRVEQEPVEGDLERIRVFPDCAGSCENLGGCKGVQRVGVRGDLLLKRCRSAEKVRISACSER